MSNFEQHLVHFLIKIVRTAECSKAVNFVIYILCKFVCLLIFVLIYFFLALRPPCKGKGSRSWFRC